MNGGALLATAAIFTVFLLVTLSFCWLCIKMDRPHARLPWQQQRMVMMAHPARRMVHRIYAEDGVTWTDYEDEWPT